MAGSEKSDGAFRTIREVADWLVVPTHVLRFWESKFGQIAPVKGSGGRRYYRPEDMKLLGGIKVMLHDQGLTIRGVSQKIDDEGVEAVMVLSPDLDSVEAQPKRPRRVIRPDDEPDNGKVVAFDRRPERPAPSVDTPSEPNEPTQPDAPAGDTEPPQPVDTDSPSQPDEEPLGERDTPPQPDPEIAIETAPDSDPVKLRTNERGPEGHPGATPAPPEPAPFADSTAALSPAITSDALGLVLDPLEKRRLRRIVRKLRGLIAEVEEEIAKGDQR
ncbi:DNA-binding transcriptional regulator, MerR family [Jannaschia faecimaris]|uniref:DNA-binding transcriptional regulator, MerR family n=1 Tax=Jannaschia faecimaris TaxID=1244108 RepID=A0A1H3QLA8_9RHOB|nr:MerR family transcriptional regulator [Jannaschia faecimaris]SDZ13765.1 DNA-binding transcriptional regulator, MerR family [Jannaschia faecimaris]